MVNNAAIFNGALVGSAGGAQERWPVDQSAASYANFASAAQALATMVDSRVAALPGGGSDGQAQLMQSICQGVLANRYLTSLSPADYADLSLAIAAIFGAVNAKLQPSASNTALTSPVYIESYMAAAGNDIRTAILAAYAANTGEGITFVYPAGRFLFVGGPITLAHGFRNNTVHSFYGCEMYRDKAGVAGGQEIFFLRLETDATHADRMTFLGGKFSLLNCLTSYFGAAIYLESASNCTCVDTEFFCSLTGAATTGRIRWGLAFLGGTAANANGGGVKNFIDRVRTTICQIQLCGQGRSVDGVICSNIESTSNNDFMISCVSSPGFEIRNVTIDTVVGHDVAGGGCIFVGSDGVGPNDIVENVTLNNISIDGSKNPVLDFVTASIVIVTLGANSQNVVVNNVNTTLVSTELNCRSVLIQSVAGEILSQDITVSNCNLGITSTNVPLEALYITGVNVSRVKIVNVTVRGQRGIRIEDCDDISISNVSTTDGSLSFKAVSRSLTKILISNSAFRTTELFNPIILFQSTSGKSFSHVHLDNLIVDGNTTINTTLAGGTMSMILCNVNNTQGNNPTAETLTGIIRAVNTPGLQIFTPITVLVPAVLAGQVGYVNVSMAGTRMSTIVVNEAVCVNPLADLVAAGVGGGFLNARVQATGSVRLAFVGPLPGGNADFNFARAAA